MRIAGYAALFDRPDRGGDIIRKGAFAHAARAGLPLYWQHDPRQRIGFVERIAEDDTGLRVIAKVDEGAATRLARSVREGQGLSFGYRVQAMRQGRYRELTRLDLIEVSLVERPMQPEARVLVVG